MTANQSEITNLFLAAKDGEGEALRAIFKHIYPELRRLAHVQRRGGEATLDTTGLVHECFLKLASGKIEIKDRGHFFALSSRVMRQVLVDFARQRLSEKRGGKVELIALDQIQIEEQREAEQMLQVNELLDQLANVNARHARVVECRFFAGLSESETAEALSMSERSVQRDWMEARAWLKAQAIQT